MQRKFWIKAAIALTAALLLSAPLAEPALAASSIHEIFVMDGDLPFSATSAQAVRNTLYVLINNKLLSLNENQMEPALAMDCSQHPEVNWNGALLASDGECLYVLDPFTGSVYQPEGDALKPVVRLDVSTLGEDLGDGFRNVMFECPFVQNGFLYALYTNPDAYPEKELYRFSLQSGEGVQLSTSPYSLTQITPYKEAQILGVDYDAQRIVAIDAGSGKPIGEIQTPAGSKLAAAAYDSARDKLYYLSNTEIMLWENQRPITVDYLAADSTGSAIYAGIWNGLYTFLDGPGLYTCNTAPGGTQGKIKPLTLWYEPGTFSQPELFSKFMKLYPETPLAVRGMENENPLDKISIANLTGDASIDIFMVPSYLIAGRQLFKKGFAEPLSSTALKNDLSSMYPQIQDFLTLDGALYGFPAQLYLQYWTVRPELLDETELGEIPQTVDDYLDMMLLWYEDFFSSHPAYTFAGNQTVLEQWRGTIDFLIVQYIYAYASDDQPLSFNTPPFRSALEKLSALSKWKARDAALARSEEAYYQKSIFNPWSVSPFIQDINPDHEGEQYFFPPRFAEASQPALGTTMLYFIVNPHSQNKEAAFNFLEFFSKHMVAELKYLLHPDFNQLIQRSDYQNNVQWYIEDITKIKDVIKTLEEEHSLADFSNSQQAQAYENAFQSQLRLQTDMLEQREAELAQAEKVRWIYTPEAIGEYRKLAPYMNLDHRSLIWAIADEVDAWSILSRYLQGSATLDQALTELDRKVAMIFLEAK